MRPGVLHRLLRSWMQGVAMTVALHHIDHALFPLQGVGSRDLLARWAACSRKLEDPATHEIVRELLYRGLHATLWTP